ncbi:unnamed protein product [Diplocarpon coronariae]
MSISPTIARRQPVTQSAMLSSNVIRDLFLGSSTVFAFYCHCRMLILCRDSFSQARTKNEDVTQQNHLDRSSSLHSPDFSLHAHPSPQQSRAILLHAQPSPPPSHQTHIILLPRSGNILPGRPQRPRARESWRIERRSVAHASNLCAPFPLLAPSRQH